MHYKKFEEFVNSINEIAPSGTMMQNRGTLHTMHPGNTHHSYGNPAIQVKLLGMWGAKDELEPRSGGGGERKVELKKGDSVEVFDMKSKKTYDGKFISAKKNKKGYYIEITIIDDSNKLQVLKPGHIIEEE